jgi:regulator of RNase E activity RraA
MDRPRRRTLATIHPGDIVSADVDGTFVARAAEFQKAARGTPAIEAHERIIVNALGRGVPLGELLMKNRND